MNDETTRAVDELRAEARRAQALDANLTILKNAVRDSSPQAAEDAFFQVWGYISAVQATLYVDSPQELRDVFEPLISRGWLISNTTPPNRSRGISISAHHPEKLGEISITGYIRTTSGECRITKVGTEEIPIFGVECIDD